MVAARPCSSAEAKISPRTDMDTAEHLAQVQAPQPQAAGVTELRVPRSITKQREIPTFASCLSVKDGLIELRQDDQQVVAILQVGEREATLLWTGSARDRDVYIAAQSRIRTAGYKLIEV